MVKFCLCGPIYILQTPIGGSHPVPCLSTQIAERQGTAMYYMETQFYTYQIYFMIFIKKINANRSDWPRPILLLSSGQAQAIKSLFIYSILYVVYIILISKCQYCCMIINIVQHKIQQQSRLLVKLYKFVSFPLFSFVSLQIQLEKQKQDTGSSITLGNTMFTCLPNDTNFMPRIMVRIVGRSN